MLLVESLRVRDELLVLLETHTECVEEGSLVTAQEGTLQVHLRSRVLNIGSLKARSAASAASILQNAIFKLCDPEIQASRCLASSLVGREFSK